MAIPSSSLSRRRLLKYSGLSALGIAAAPLLAACGGDDDESGSSSGTGALSVQLSWVKDIEWGPLFMADSKGYYKAEGLTLNMIPGGPDIGSIEGIVAGGSTNIGIATDITSTIAAAADGNPLVVVGALYQTNLNTLMSPPDKPITSVAQMVGKKVGGPQGTQTKFDAMFKLAGLEPKYTFVPTGYGPDALLNGDCDVQAGFITDEVLAYTAKKGAAPAQLTFEDAGLPAYTLSIFTTKSELEKDRDKIKSFLRATRKGFDDFKASPDEAATLAANTYGKDAGLKVDDEKKKAAAYLPLGESETTRSNGWLYLDIDEIAGGVFKGMQAAGLKTPSNAKDIVDLSLLDELNKE